MKFPPECHSTCLGFRQFSHGLSKLPKVFLATSKFFGKEYCGCSGTYLSSLSCLYQFMTLVLPTVFPLRSEKSVLGLKAFWEDHVRTCFNICRCLHGRLSQLQDANRCCQMLSMLESCDYCILVFNVWGRCSFHSFVETFTRPGWRERDFRKETSQSEWSFDYCQNAVYRLPYNHNRSYLDCI